VQIGGAAALLVATIALTRLPARIASAPPHFETRHVSEMNVRAPKPTNGWLSFHTDVERILAGVPGVRRVAFATAIPVSDEGIGSVTVTSSGAVRRALPAIEVSPSYFDVLGIQIERGRALATTDVGCDRSVCPVVISRAAAREFWDNADPIGQRLSIDRSLSLEVVGVASDASSDIADRSQALMLYQAWRPDDRLYQPFIRGDRNTETIARTAADALTQRFAGLVAAPRTLEQQLTLMTDAFQRIGVVVGALATITALLAIVGVYGVIALAAKRRLKEMGIRIALGARRGDVYRAMIAHNARSVAIGLVAGAALATLLAVASDRILAAVFPVRVVDPLAFIAAACSLATAATLAMLLPARRVTRMDPSRVLRQD
jgi:ABC-type antimicrobial peptide transport system permease subunit